jgi:hypothetical protein
MVNYEVKMRHKGNSNIINTVGSSKVVASDNSDNSNAQC